MLTQYAISDPIAPHQEKTISVRMDGIGISIHPEGCGTNECEDCAPIYLEYYNGRFRLIVWDDINSEEPTHKIDLTSALESERKG